MQTILIEKSSSNPEIAIMLFCNKDATFENAIFDYVIASTAKHIHGALGRMTPVEFKNYMFDKKLS